MVPLVGQSLGLLLSGFLQGIGCHCVSPQHLPTSSIISLHTLFFCRSSAATTLKRRCACGWQPTTPKPPPWWGATPTAWLRQVPWCVVACRAWALQPELLNLSSAYATRVWHLAVERTGLARPVCYGQHAPRGPGSSAWEHVCGSACPSAPPQVDGNRDMAHVWADVDAALGKRQAEVALAGAGAGAGAVAAATP